MAATEPTSLRVFIITRLFLMVPMFLTLLTIVFVILHVVPGDPVRALMGPRASEEVVNRMRHELQLDRPLYMQYITYVANLLRGDLGFSIWTRTPVLTNILQVFPATLEYSVPTIIVAALTGVSSGSLSALKRNSSYDMLNRILTIALYSLPLFWLGMILQLSFGLGLRWLPVTGRIDPRIELTRITGFNLIDSILTGNFEAFVSSISHLILPVITMMVWISCIINRIARTEMITILRQDYIAAANARGIPRNLVIYRHALRNALVPLVTMMGLIFAWLLGGTAVVEITFSIYGMGRLFITGIYNRDFPLIQGIVVFYSIIVAVISLAIDLVYAYIDPRIRF